jgi:mannosyltransferase
VPWVAPALLTVALGCYQIGRPELWRDELSSWSFAARPVSDLIATARNTGATQLAYYLLLHFWITAFGSSADAMRSLSVLAMAGAAACAGRPQAGRVPGGPGRRAGLRAGAERVTVRPGGSLLLP